MINKAFATRPTNHPDTHLDAPPSTSYQSEASERPQPILARMRDDELMAHIQETAASERRVYAKMIQALDEIERRKLYLVRGYSSLFAFCTRKLKYSAAAAQRRIDSMRLLKNFPKGQRKRIEQKIQSGSINLSHLSQVAQAVRNIPKNFSCDEKIKLIEKVENTTGLECQKRLVKEGAVPISKRENLRIVNDGEYRLAINLDQESMRLLEKLIALGAHSNPWASKQEAVKSALKIAVENLEKTRKRELLNRGKKRPNGQPPEPKKSGSKTSSTKTIRAKAETKVRTNTGAEVKSNVKKHDQSSKTMSFKKTRHIPNRSWRAIWERDDSKCQYVDPKTGRKCESEHGLQVDHKKEFSRGGDHSPENLRLLCRAHNLARNKPSS